MNKKNSLSKMSGGNSVAAQAILNHKKEEYKEEQQEAEKYQQEAAKQAADVRKAHNEVVMAEQNAALAHRHNIVGSPVSNLMPTTAMSQYGMNMPMTGMSQYGIHPNMDLNPTNDVPIGMNSYGMPMMGMHSYGMPMNSYGMNMYPHMMGMNSNGMNMYPHMMGMSPYMMGMGMYGGSEKNGNNLKYKVNYSK